MGNGEQMKSSIKTFAVLAGFAFVLVSFFQNCGTGFDGTSGNPGSNLSSINTPDPTTNPSPSNPNPNPNPTPTPTPLPAPTPTPVVLQNTFMTMPQSGAIPSARAWGASTFLTGKNKFFIWGGRVYTGNDVALADGALYDLNTGAWKKVSTVGAPPALNSSTAVWTGTKVVVWGGTGVTGPATNQGWMYDPDADTWAPLPQTNPPTGRLNHVMVLVGTKIVMWGGFSNGGINSGAAYDLATGVWTAIAAAPISGRSSTFAASIGDNKMIVWGGGGCVACTGGAIYDLANNTWKLISKVGEPATRHKGVAAWTGTEFLVYGGRSTGGGALPTMGGFYNPATDTWRVFPVNNGPDAYEPYFGWSGTSLLVWGGLSNLAELNSGFIFY